MKPEKLILKPGREKSLLRRHPWVFSGAIARIGGDPPVGATVAVHAHDGRFLAWAAYSPTSQIAARAWSFDPGDSVDAGFIARRIRHTAGLRRRPPDGGTRLVNAESDGLPGLIVDRYAAVAVIQCNSAGAAHWRDAVADALTGLEGIERVYERSDADVLQLEGLGSRTGWLRGSGDTRVRIVENGLQFTVDVARGQKTGFYLDQRVNRETVARHAAGRSVLNVFCYTGGFSLHALQAGASEVLSVDSSADALALAREHVLLNDLPAERASWLEADAFACLRALRDQARQFDLVVLDPPKFAPTPAAAQRAARGYKDINLLAFKLLRQDGLLATFSCSGGVSRELFQKIVAGAAVDAGVDAQILHRFEAAPDHPVGLHFPEGEYLKGLLCRRQN